MAPSKRFYSFNMRLANNWSGVACFDRIESPVAPIVKLVVITLLESKKLVAPGDEVCLVMRSLPGATDCAMKLIGPLKHESPALEADCRNTS